MDLLRKHKTRNQTRVSADTEYRISTDMPLVHIYKLTMQSIATTMSGMVRLLPQRCFQNREDFMNRFVFLTTVGCLMLPVYVGATQNRVQKCADGASPCALTDANISDDGTDLYLKDSTGNRLLVNSSWVRVLDHDGTIRLSIVEGGDTYLRDAQGSYGLSIDSTNNLVGIWDNTPSFGLDVNGTGRFVGNLTLDADLKLGGADILDSGGITRITATAAGTLLLKEDGGATALTVQTDGNVAITNDLKLGGADIQDSSGTSRITATTSGALVLKDSVGAAVITLNTAGGVELEQNDLQDSGGTTRIQILDGDDTSFYDHEGTLRLSICGGTNNCVVSGLETYRMMGTNLYLDNSLSAATVFDRSPYPESVDVAYAAVESMGRLPEGEYDASDSSKQLDHSRLHPFVGGNNYRSLSATASAHNEVLKDLIDRLAAAEAACAARPPASSGIPSGKTR